MTNPRNLLVDRIEQGADCRFARLQCITRTGNSPRQTVETLLQRFVILHNAGKPSCFIVALLKSSLALVEFPLEVMLLFFESCHGFLAVTEFRLEVTLLFFQRSYGIDMSSVCRAQ